MLISTIIALVIVTVLAYRLGPTDSELKEILQDCEELQDMLSKHIAVLDEQQEIVKRERMYLQTIGMK